MNCFEWQNRTSEHLDGTLNSALQSEADQHLETCPTCQERHQHYRKILSSIAEQPRHSLPATIRSAPFSFSLPKAEQDSKQSKWEKTPWFVRTSIEGLGLAFIAVFVIALIPRIRDIYEKSIERRLDAFSLVEFSNDSTSNEKNLIQHLPLARGKTSHTDDGATSDDFSSSEAESDSDITDDPEIPEIGTANTVVTDDGHEIRVGNSEIWRFNLKTDSPHDIRPKIVRILTELNVSPATPGIGGIEAPGGIQFDLLVPKNTIPMLKQSLEKLSPTSTAPQNSHTGAAQPRLAHSSLKDPFTWYKNRSRRSIPTGQTRVVIWLSQM